MSSLLFGQASDPKVVSPFGQLPYNTAGGIGGQFAGPLRQGFGFNPSQRFENRLQDARGPLADLIRNVQGMVPGMAEQAQNLGAETAARGSQAYQTLTGQIDNFMKMLPQYQQQANTTAGYGQQGLQQAFDPVQQSALYGQASQRMLEQMRPGEAARGLESSGSAQAGENRALQDLTFQFAQNQQAAEQQALQGAAGSTGAAAQMAQAGINPAQQWMQGVGQAQDLQSQQFQLPMQALGSILQLLMGGMSPSNQLLQQTAPSVAQQSGKDFFGAHF